MIKRLIFRVIMLIVIASGIMSYIASLNGIDLLQFLPKFERPQLPNFKLPEVPDLKLFTTDDQDALPPTVSKVYKWRGEDGTWHFSEELPEGVTSVETLFLNSDTNIIKGLPQPDKVNTSVDTTNDNTPSQPQTQSVNLNPYSKKAIEKLLNDAKGVQKMIDNHTQQIEEATQIK